MSLFAKIQDLNDHIEENGKTVSARCSLITVAAIDMVTIYFSKEFLNTIYFKIGCEFFTLIFKERNKQLCREKTYESVYFTLSFVLNYIQHVFLSVLYILLKLISKVPHICNGYNPNTVLQNLNLFDCQINELITLKLIIFKAGLISKLL